ncbi:MAG: response regulator [Proteobacteria bacterium]|nr:response regulator [Pseudomonadota bacterium]
MRILLADDSSAIQKVMKLSLGRVGYDVDVVTQLTSFKKKLADHTFDLLIVSGALAGTKTISELKKITHNLGYESPKVLVLTGSYDSLQAQDFKQAGFSQVLAKPFSKEHVVSKVAALVPLPEQVTPTPSQDQEAPRIRAGAESTVAITTGTHHTHETHHSSPPYTHSNPGNNGLQTVALSPTKTTFEPYPGAQLLGHNNHHTKDFSTVQARDVDQTKQHAPLTRLDGATSDTQIRPTADPEPIWPQIDLDLLAAEVLSRIKDSLKKDIQLGLSELVQGHFETDLRTIIKEELRNLIDERSRL